MPLMNRTGGVLARAGERGGARPRGLCRSPACVQDAAAAAPVLQGLSSEPRALCFVLLPSSSLSRRLLAASPGHRGRGKSNLSFRAETEGDAAGSSAPSVAMSPWWPRVFVGKKLLVASSPWWPRALCACEPSVATSPWWHVHGRGTLPVPEDPRGPAALPAHPPRSDPGTGPGGSVLPRMSIPQRRIVPVEYFSTFNAISSSR